jgi:hypothetical protein
MRFPSWLQKVEKVDATKPCTLNVLPKDIEGARPENGAKCVAARCVKRALGAKHVYFYRTTAYILFGDGRPVERFVTSGALLRNVIHPLDTGKLGRIKPGRYDLLPPPESYRLGKAVENRTSRTLAGQTTLVRRKYKARRMLGRIRSA